MRLMLPAALALITCSAHAGTFTDLDAPGLQLTGISANGRAASLYSLDGGFRWAKDIGVKQIPGIAEIWGENSWGQALGGSIVDTDGNIVAAFANSNNGIVTVGAWPGGAAVDNFLSETRGVADNGIAVGLARDETGKAFAFSWSAPAGMTKLPVNRPDNASRANRASADGSVVVGWNDQNNGFRSGVIWTNGVAMDIVGPTPDPSFFVPVGEATAVSRDGRTVVGVKLSDFSTMPPKQGGWRWTAETGPQSLGCLEGAFGCDAFSPRAVSDDGSVIVGDVTSGGAYVAAIWTQADGVQKLSDYLPAHGLVVPADWSLQSAAAVSADGKTIGGWGVSPTSVFTSFVADARDAAPTEALVEAHGTVQWNDLPEGPFAGLPAGTTVTMTFRATSVGANEIEPGKYTAYPIVLDSFSLQVGSASDTLVATEFGPTLHIANDFPLSDGIHLMQSPMAANEQMEFEMFGAGSGALAGAMFDSDDLDRINRTFGPEFFEKTAWSITQGDGGEFGMYMSLDSVSITDYDPAANDLIFVDGFDTP